MISLLKTDASNPDFIQLVKELDTFLSITDGEDHAFYDQYNKLTAIKNVVIAYHNKQPIGCGAIKEYNATTMEVKRMYTKPLSRGKGVASEILITLEIWAKSLNYKYCILETGVRQVEAISLYLKNGYTQIDNYGPYINIEDSVCFEKKLQ